MKSIFPDSIMDRNGSLTIDGIVGKLFYFSNQSQMYHWQTDCYREHIVLGNLYEFINAKRDGIVENIMGFTGMKPGNVKIDVLQNYEEECAYKLAGEICLFVKQLKSYAESNGMVGVAAIADELSIEINKVKYLLTLG